MNRRITAAASAAGAFLLCASPALALVGVASFYGGGEKLNRHTANGEVFDPRAMTAAHWTLPIGTKVVVTNPRNGKSVVVRINDRGPHPRLRRMIDLTRAAAQRIGVTLGTVHMQVL